MTRLIKSLILIALLVTTTFVSLPSAYAVPTDDSGNGGSDCSAFNGHTPLATADLYKQYQKSPCSKDGGGCTAKQTKKNNKKAFAITCTESSSGGGSGSGSSSSSGDGGTSCDQDTECVEDPAFSEAATCTTDNCGLISNYINPLIVLMTVLVGIAVTIGIVFGAIEVISSAGDPQRNASGKGHIRNALIALVAYAILYAFLQFIIPGGLGS